MSWPYEDTRGEKGPDAKCRCLPMQRAPHGYDYARRRRSNIFLGACDGCDHCFMSWPHDSWLRRYSPKALFRCKPEDYLDEYVYGDDCPNLYDGLCGADCHRCRKSWPINDFLNWHESNAVCRCTKEDIRETIFDDKRCETSDAGLCGSRCNLCLMSWEEADTLGADGPSAECRCKEPFM